MTSDAILKNLRLHNVSTIDFFYQNQFMNECTGKNLDKIQESRYPVIPKSWSLYVRCRRTYVPIKGELQTRS